MVDDRWFKVQTSKFKVQSSLASLAKRILFLIFPQHQGGTGGKV